jgi:hypothetical protein
MHRTFFDTLQTDTEFLPLLGGLVCAASKFEDILDDYIALNPSPRKLTLGGLLQQLRKSTHIDRTLDFHIDFAIHQRNYFVHNLYRNLKEISPSGFSKEQFKNRVKRLTEEFDFFSRLVQEELHKREDYLEET